MFSYQFMFNACRYPVKPADVEKAFNPAENEHIAVARMNKFFIVPTKQDGRPLSTAELKVQLERIITQAGDVRGPAIGVLTTENRDVWADVRSELLKAHPNNEALLRKLESSAFLLCLDDNAPVTLDEHSRACWHNDGCNRYFDKSLQFFVFANGKSGFLGEHSSMDGTPTCRLNDWVLENLVAGKIDHGTAEIRSSLTEPEFLDIKVNEKVSHAIATAQSLFATLTLQKHDLRVLAFERYGKDMIKKYRLSPDAYMQMVIQLGYYKMVGKCQPTYESAQTRKYRRGRTETCRTVSVESTAWCKAMGRSSYFGKCFNFFYNALTANSDFNHPHNRPWKRQPFVERQLMLM